MATPEDQKDDYLGMSDEDFLNINGPATTAAAASGTDGDGDRQETAGSAVVVANAEVEGETATTTESEKAQDEAADTAVDPAVGDGKAVDAAKTTPADGAAQPAGTDGKAAGTDGTAAQPASKTGDDNGAKDQDKTAPAADAQPVDYEGFFQQVMAPFKANGREFKLNSPDEAIRLMQMGAGYGRKLQDLQPALKTLKMLEKANLLDEGKLSFLIDINNKNPDAIKKLIADSGIDPLELNIGDNVSYAPKNHSVSDKEMVFHTALEDVQSHPNGQETIRLINQTWDQESKSALWESPQLLAVIQSQRENGVYAQIVTEIDRQKLLGQIPSTAPFLQAYKLAGDHLQANNGFKITETPNSIQTRSGDTPSTQVIATRTAAPKAQVQNGDKAAAAASTKTTTSRKAGVTVNPLDMADDDFLKTFKDRL